MSLEFALDKYPVEVRLRDCTATTIRPLKCQDEVRLRKFFEAVPEEERLFIKHPLSDKRLLRDWCRKLDYEQNLPLVMLCGGRIIGEATLHQRPGGWKRHIGLVTVLTHPDHRGLDVAKLLVQEILHVAPYCGLKKLESEFNGGRKVAIRALMQLGFREIARVRDHLRDMQYRPHDWVLLGTDLITDEEYTSAG
jgi:GNAT superfamily N-acetyltransferase